MIRGVLAALIEGLVAPRASARRMLTAELRPEVAIQMVILAYLIEAIVQIVLPGGRALPEEAKAAPLTLHLLNLTLHLVLTGVLAMLVFGVGRAFGGTGNRGQALVIVAWHTLVTTLLAPIMLWGAADLVAGEPVAPGRFLLLLTGSAVWLWLLAVYTAELHGFRSARAVLAVILAAVAFLTALFLNLR